MEEKPYRQDIRGLIYRVVKALGRFLDIQGRNLGDYQQETQQRVRDDLARLGRESSEFGPLGGGDY